MYTEHMKDIVDIFVGIIMLPVTIFLEIIGANKKKE